MKIHKAIITEYPDKKGLEKVGINISRTHNSEWESFCQCRTVENALAIVLALQPVNISITIKSNKITDEDYEKERLKNG